MAEIYTCEYIYTDTCICVYFLFYYFCVCLCIFFKKKSLDKAYREALWEWEASPVKYL